jgi:integrase
VPKAFLLRRPSGLYARFLLPADIRAKTGTRYLVRPLRSTGDAARLLAARMGYALAQAIQSIRCAGGDLDTKSQLERAIRSVAFPVSTGYEINVPGLLTIKADGPAGHARVMEALAVLQTVIPGLPGAGAWHAASASRALPSGPTLHESAKRFLAHYSSTSRAASTQLEAEHSVALFCDLIDDIPIADLGPTHVDAFREALASWPARARVLPAYRGLSAKAIVAKAKTRGEGGLSIRTMEKHLDRLRTFFNWSVQRRELAHNPLAGLRLQTSADKYTKTKRGFRPEELSALFDPVRRAKQCDDDPMYFWIPLLGLFTGSRLSEAAQLLVSDLADVGGVWGVHITGEGAKSVKNAQSNRFVPVPERLLALGLLDYAADVKALGFAALFPGGSVGAKNGPGDRVGKWFNRTLLRGACGISDKAVSYHSTRHTFITAGDKLGFSEAQVGALTGHEARSVQARHYIDASTVTQRKERIDRIAASLPVPPMVRYRAGQFAKYFERLRRIERRARTETSGGRVKSRD